MTWLDLLKHLDTLRVKVRNEPGFAKPRSVVPANSPLIQDLEQLALLIQQAEPAKKLELELDAEGKPIITEDMRDLFATLPQAAHHKASDVGRSPRKHQGAAPAGAATTASVLPRDTPRISRPPSGVEADANTVAPDVDPT